MYRTITDLNGCNGAPLYNDNIRDAIHRVIVEDEADAHNVTVYTFSQIPVTPNTQGYNENTILTSKKQKKSVVLAETLKGLTLYNIVYFESDSVNEINAKSDPESNLKVSTHTSGRKKIKVTDTSNGYLKKNIE